MIYGAFSRNTGVPKVVDISCNDLLYSGIFYDDYIFCMLDKILSAVHWSHLVVN